MTQEPALGGEQSSEQNTARMRVWTGDYGREYPDDPDETVELDVGENVLWVDDPHYFSGSIAFDIHPDDRDATLYIYTNDSVRCPPTDHAGEWGRPIEKGLTYRDDDGYGPFGCKVWGRVLVRVEEGITR